MGRSKKQYDDDDGRTIADMGQVSPTPMFIPRRPGSAPDNGGRGGSGDPSCGASDSRKQEQTRQDRPWEDNSLTAKERLMYVLGAMKATMLIALAYLAGLAAIVWLLLKLWS